MTEQRRTTAGRRRVAPWWVVPAVVGAAVGLLARATPWPSAMVIRWAFERGARQTSRILAPLVPAGVTAHLDEVYDPTDPDGRFDVFHPSALDGTDRALPTVVWVHGGGWVSGSKADVAEYAQILAARGYTVVTVDYSIAPEHRYPRPVEQVCAAVRHVVAHAAELHVDPERIALAGDSAGAQIAAQITTVVTSPDYARRLGTAAPLDPAQLRAVVLFCGAYDVARVQGTGLRGWFLHTVMWAYSGTAAYATDPRVALASVRDHVTSAFAPTFVSAGNADPLGPHSADLAAALADLAVPVQTLFFPADHTPALGHEYQLRLDTDAGRLALDRLDGFLRERLAGAAPAGAPVVVAPVVAEPLVGEPLVGEP